MSTFQDIQNSHNLKKIIFSSVKRIQKFQKNILSPSSQVGRSGVHPVSIRDRVQLWILELGDEAREIRI